MINYNRKRDQQFVIARRFLSLADQGVSGNRETAD